MREKSGKKTGKGILTTVLAGSFYAFILNLFYKKTNHFQNEISGIIKFNNNMPSGLDIVNLGSNHARYAFDYENQVLKGMNWAVSPQSLEYDYKILRKYYDKIASGGVVAITLPYCIFLYDEYEEACVYDKYYYFLDKNQIEDYMFLKKIMVKYFPLFYRGKNITYIFRDEDKNPYGTADRNLLMKKESLMKDANCRINGWEKQFGISLQEKCSERNLQRMVATREILLDMIQFCKEKDLKSVFVIPPVSDYLNERVPSQFLEEVLYHNLKLCNIEEERVFDYSHDSRFQKAHLYSNCDFLNKRGRKFFTESFIKDLSVRKII